MGRQRSGITERPSFRAPQYPQSYELHLSSDDDGNSTIPDKGYEWDTGIHYVGNSINADSGSSTGKVLEFLTDSKLKWESMGDLIDVIKLKAKVGPKLMYLAGIIFLSFPYLKIIMLEYNSEPFVGRKFRRNRQL